jgi:hypothetical protein
MIYQNVTEIKHPIKKILDGDKGSSLFYSPLLTLPDLTKSYDLPEFLQKIKKSGDDRSYALMSALVIENYLDRVLSVIIPDFKRFIKDHEVSLSEKLDLLKSMQLIPIHLISCAHAARAVRNDFAHNLELNSFDNLSQNTKDKLRTAYDLIPVRRAYEELTTKEVFDQVVFIAVSGFSIYLYSIALLFKVIRDPKFEEHLRVDSMKINRDYLDALKKLDQSTSSNPAS